MLGMSARVLLIDDDPTLLDVLAMAFEDAGHQTHTAVDGAAGLESIAPHEPDVVISDVNMPRVDGFSLCRTLREAGNGVPVILLTSRDSEIDETLGLDLGADDYVSKPFSTRVLLARVAALVRRTRLADSPDRAEPTLTRGKLALDAERLTVEWDAQLIPVTVTEFRLIDRLASRPGVVYTRGQLMDHMRADDSVVADRIVDTYVRRVRRKFEAADADFAEIETVVGMGYRWRHA